MHGVETDWLTDHRFMRKSSVGFIPRIFPGWSRKSISIFSLKVKARKNPGAGKKVCIGRMWEQIYWPGQVVDPFKTGWLTIDLCQNLASYFFPPFFLFLDEVWKSLKIFSGKVLKKKSSGVGWEGGNRISWGKRMCLDWCGRTYTLLFKHASSRSPEATIPDRHMPEPVYWVVGCKGVLRSVNAPGNYSPNSFVAMVWSPKSIPSIRYYVRLQCSTQYLVIVEYDIISLPECRK